MSSSPLNRRNFLTLAGGAALLAPVARMIAQGREPATSDGSTKPFFPAGGTPGYRPVVTPNGATLHQGMKVRRGTKYIITKWFREYPAPYSMMRLG